MSELIINDILCYISTARNSKTDDYIIQCCLPFFNISKIKEAKSLICTYSSDRPIHRRGDNLIKSELTDILELFRKCEESNITLPKFVAESYDSMPPGSGFELISNTIMSLIEEIQTLRDEIKIIKDSSIRENIIIDDTAHIKTDLIDIKENIRDLKLKIFSDKIGNLNRDMFLNDSLSNFNKSIRKMSMPQSLNNCNESILLKSSLDDSTDTSHPSLLNIGQIPSSIPQTDFSELKSPLKSEMFMPSAPPLSQEISSCNSYASALKSQVQPSNIKTSKSSIYKSNTESNNSTQVNNEKFKSVNHKKKNRQHGIVGIKEDVIHLSAMKSSPKHYDLYVGRCNSKITTDIVNEYLRDELQINTYACEEVQCKIPDCKSFKISVSVEDRETLLNPNTWPVGIVCRKYYNIKK